MPLSLRNEKLNKEKERRAPLKRLNVNSQAARNSQQCFHIHVQNG
jgi:hypothetical protein